MSVGDAIGAAVVSHVPAGSDVGRMHSRATTYRSMGVWNRVLVIPAVLALSWVLVGVIRYSMAAPPSFDGAMNLNTAASMLNGRGYGFFYDIFFPFPAQTDGPFILPAALALWLGGVTPFTAQVVNLGYVMAFGALGFALFRRFELPAWLAVCGVLVLVATPGFIEYGMNGYGEVPVMVWYWAGLLALGKSLRDGDEVNVDACRVAAGALFGLAYLTKVVAVIVVAPVFLVYCLLLVRRPSVVRNVIPLCAGFVAPVLAWELFRFVQLGGVSGFGQWWSLQLGQISSQSGAQHVGAAVGWLEKGGTHLSVLGSLLGLPVGLLVLYLMAPHGLALLRSFGGDVSRERRLYLGSMAVAAMLYCVWWLFVTPTSMAWLRRILIGVLIIQCLTVIGVWGAVQAVMATRVGAGQAWRTWGALVCVLPALVGQIGLAAKGELVTRLAEGPPDSSRLLALARTVGALPPDAVIFGTGWWKAPVLALFSGREVSNFQRWQAFEINALARKFFVVDAYARHLAQDEVTGVLAVTEYKLVAESDAGAVYEILHVRDYAPFSKADEDVPRLSAVMDFSLGDYAFKRGFYGVEGGAVAWMRPNGAVMLRRFDEERLRISIVVPERLLGKRAASAAQLRVGAAGCLNETVPLSKPGYQQFEFVLSCPAGERVKPFLVTLSVDRHLPAVPQIDADNRLLALLVQSVGVYHGSR